MFDSLLLFYTVPEKVCCSAGTLLLRTKSTAVGTSGVCKTCIRFAESGGHKDFQFAHVPEVGLIWAGFNSPFSVLSSRTCGFLGIIF